MPVHRSRFHRKPLRRIVLQARDICIIVALFLCRCLTITMIQNAFFSADGLSRARRRMRDLYDWGIVDRQFVNGDEAIYLLGKNGLPYALQWCADHGIEVEPADARAQMQLPAQSLVKHTLLVARLFLACRAHLGQHTTVHMDKWLFESAVRAQFQIRRVDRNAVRPAPWRTVVFKPDAMLQVSGVPGLYRTIFLEADRATETSRQIATKLETHKLFLDTGQFTALYDGDETFCTMLVTVGHMDGRVRNLAEIAARVEASFVLTTTLSAFEEMGPLACPCVHPTGELTTLSAVLNDATLKGDVS